ncbi:MAG: hypothetical protein ABSG94_10490 [Brevinematales bacterium]
MQSVLLLPENTEMKSLEEKIRLLKDIRIVPAGSEETFSAPLVYLDLTFDIFNKNVTEEYLYNQFSLIHATLGPLNYPEGVLTIIKNYPFKTNVNRFLRILRIIENFVSFLSEFYRARIIFVPSIISRHGFQILNTPPIRLINALRLDKTDQVNVRDASRFYLIYEMDALDSIYNRKAVLEKDIVVEGIELSLRDIYERSCRIVGNTPVRFDQANFINFEYPEENSDPVLCLNYDLEDMVIDITNYLF